MTVRSITKTRVSRLWSGSVAVIAMLAAGAVQATPVSTREGVLPPGTELYEELLDQPTEIFTSEAAGGKRSYLLNLGDMAFSSPAIFGGPARDAAISCNTCHQQGAGNPRLFIPGLSSRPGTFDTTGALFNPKADNGVLDAVTPPSLRGAKYLAPYGHDGRFASLRDFVRNVIVNEFAGPEPSAQTLDALVNYIQEIAFLPNAKLAPGGRLTAKASDAARRGEAIFNRPFPHDAAMSCATCHVRSGAFVDHSVHDVGSGGLFKTPTLINANFNAPYFHDGRYDSYGQVVEHFDRHFDLGLSGQERADLVAYLDAVGDADEPFTRNTVAAETAELEAFASVLEVAIPARDIEVINLAVDSVGAEWREFGENFPERTNTTVSGGLAQRRQARDTTRELALGLRRIAMAAAEGDYTAAAEHFAEYRRQATEATPIFVAAEPWSLFNPQIRIAYLGALKELTTLAQADAVKGEVGGGR